MAKDKQSCYNLFLMTEKRIKLLFGNIIYFPEKKKNTILDFWLLLFSFGFYNKTKKNITRFLAEDVNLSLESSNMLHMTS